MRKNLPELFLRIKRNNYPDFDYLMKKLYLFNHFYLSTLTKTCNYENKIIVTVHFCNDRFVY